MTRQLCPLARLDLLLYSAQIQLWLAVGASVGITLGDREAARGAVFSIGIGIRYSMSFFGRQMRIGHSINLTSHIVGLVVLPGRDIKAKARGDQQFAPPLSLWRQSHPSNGHPTSPTSRRPQMYH